jgi:hypothetical protein
MKEIGKMPKAFKRKKLNNAYNNGWFDGYAEGVGTGMIEAIGILETQQEKFGGIAAIDDLIKLINNKTAITVQSYRDDT